MKSQKPTLLVILDGLGIADPGPCNAVAQARTPHLSAWFKNYPHTLLQAAGHFVGLPDGYVGNSEVGHLTIGAGRIIKQPLTVINEAIAEGSFYTNPVLTDAFDQLTTTSGNLHILGLLSDAGVHSHIQHLFAFLRSAKQYEIKNVYIHAFLDGRDVPSKSAAHYLKMLDNFISKEGIGTLASVHGRFYAMDRDHNEERTQASYEALVTPQSKIFNHWQEILDYYYEQNITDEFIPPTQLQPAKLLQNGDGILCFNYRPDRVRQITACFVSPNFTHFPRKNISLIWFMTPYPYGANFDTRSLFEHPIIKHTLKEVLNAHHKTIFAIAETEKYAHVTYFFNGENEEQLARETRVLVPSLKEKNYVHAPCMSAPKITDTILSSLQNNPCDFYVINYANADMVGHSGDLLATIAAIDCLDHELGRLFDAVVTNYDGTMYITADHGKAEIMHDAATGNPRTAHTESPVPFIVITKKNEEIPPMVLPLYELSDIAPYILENMGIAVPHEMKKD